jgi:hypothetical protein
MPIIDALLLCHVSWVLETESVPKKIGSSQRYEVEKLAQNRWDIRRVSKNPEKSETRPDPNFSGFQMSDLRNLKFY